MLQSAVSEMLHCLYASLYGFKNENPTRMSYSKFPDTSSRFLELLVFWKHLTKFVFVFSFVGGDCVAVSRSTNTTQNCTLEMLCGKAALKNYVMMIEAVPSL